MKTREGDKVSSELLEVRVELVRESQVANIKWLKSPTTIMEDGKSGGE